MFTQILSTVDKLNMLSQFERCAVQCKKIVTTIIAEMKKYPMAPDFAIFNVNLIVLSCSRTVQV